VLFFSDAFVNDWWQFEGFIRGTLPDEKRRQIFDDLFIDEKGLRSAPKGWRCPQWYLLVIDEQGNVPVCCGLPNNHPSYSLGTVDDGLVERLRNRPNLPICKTCLETGIGYRGHHPAFEGDPSIPKFVLRFMMKNKLRSWNIMKMGLGRFDLKSWLEAL
jgi:hypothetical protein